MSLHSSRGIKRYCHNCAIPYYDLNKRPPSCPSCSNPYDPESFFRTRSRTRVTKGPASPLPIEQDEALKAQEDVLTLDEDVVLLDTVEEDGEVILIDEEDILPED